MAVFYADTSALVKLVCNEDESRALRALDAIHVASAADLHPIEAFVTYDQRQAAAARLAGMRTMAPGAESI